MGVQHGKKAEFTHATEILKYQKLMLQPTLYCDILVSIIIFDTKQRGDGNAKNKAADD